MATIFDILELKEDGSGLLTKNTKKVVINTLTYTATDMKSGTTPMCDKTTLTGNSWTFTQDQLPATVIYAINSPNVSYIAKDIMPTVPINKTNILTIDSPVLPSSFTATIPTTDNIYKQFTLTPINSWAGTTIANQLKDGNIELVFNLTVPSTFNQTITTLPTELRPASAKSLIGINGNSPVVITVGTNGSVKCLSTITGTLELQAQYSL